LVGRGQQEGCSLVLGDSTISRKHAHILFERISLDQAPEENYSFFLVDLGSSNGSFVNERQVSSPVMLKNGDLIRFGKVNLTFRL
jgi:pSer/pThr/pTyr-binding forkhead associated (FHA) protein